MVHGRPSFLRCALLATALLGCGTEAKIKEFAAQQRPAIERNLAALPAIAEQLRTLPPLSESGTSNMDGQHVIVVDTLADSSKPPTASLCYAEDLANPDELGYVWGRMEKTGALNHCASLLHRGHFAYDPADHQKALSSISMAEALRRFPRCAAYRYLLVLRTLEFMEPSSAARATKPFVPVKETLDLDANPTPPPAPPAPPKKRKRGSAKVAEAVEPPAADTPAIEPLAPVEETVGEKQIRFIFDGGMLRGEVLLFELPTAKLLGGVRFSAQNNVRIDGTDAAIREDLQAQIKAAMLAAVKKAIPGVDFQGEHF
jgi:hypothetical protein